MAYGFSVLLWAALTLPLLAAGFLAVGVTEVKMSELQRHAREHAQNRAQR
jgi:hypothetical protein